MSSVPRVRGRPWIGDDAPNHRPGRLLLGYRSTCPRCRFLSGLVVLASVGRIRRVPLNDLLPSLGPTAASSPDVMKGPVLWDGSVVHAGRHAHQAVRKAVLRPWR
jgi:hypothetical protein